VNGTCENAHAWKWSRTPEISAKNLAMIDEAVKATCMDTYTFVASDHNEGK
jgi:hypothetical protein